MNVASLELCKELYELSGWLPEEQVGSFYIGGSGHYVKDTIATKNTPLQIPAYDLGYLLRKLPDNINPEQVPGVYELQMTKHPEFFRFSYRNYETNRRIFLTEGTPEDAACKLAIELFKQKVLK